jgi:hypothetical protein
VQNLLLAAGALGFGSALTTLATFRTDALRSLLQLPERLRPMAVVPIGVPARRLRPGRRRPLGDVVSYDAYGTRCRPADDGSEEVGGRGPLRRAGRTGPTARARRGGAPPGRPPSARRARACCAP